MTEIKLVDTEKIKIYLTYEEKDIDYYTYVIVSAYLNNTWFELYNDNLMELNNMVNIISENYYSCRTIEKEKISRLIREHFILDEREQYEESQKIEKEIPWKNIIIGNRIYTFISGDKENGCIQITPIKNNNVQHEFFENRFCVSTNTLKKVKTKINKLFEINKKYII